MSAPVSSFEIIPPVPVMVIRYRVGLIEPAARFRDAFRKLTSNDRYKLLLQMGNSISATPSLSVEFIESESNIVRVEALDADMDIRVVKIFCNDKVSTTDINDIAAYIDSFDYWKKGYERY